MAVEANNTKSRFERLKTKYRVAVFDHKSFKELRSFHISGLNMIFAILGLFIILFLLFLAVFSIRPVKEAFFGIGDVENSSAFITLNKQVLDLEDALSNQSTYINGLLGMMNGDKNQILEANPEVLEIQEDHRNAVGTLSQTKIDQNKELKSRMIHFVSPVKGRISAGFDRAIDHIGVDIIAAKNSAISSISDGVVVGADWTIETGNTITVQHKDDIISIYKHNSSLLKSVGDYVKAGEAIAIIGNSGEQTTGPHLHFELWYKGNVLDPVQFIAF